jgi:hypothetical protein
VRYEQQSGSNSGGFNSGTREIKREYDILKRMDKINGEEGEKEGGL